jgi:tetratricopeptide (TPR) repeat protein
MKKTTALWTLTLLVIISSGAMAAEHAIRGARSVELTPVSSLQAPPQAAKPTWSGDEEYQAFQALSTEKNPAKLITLAEAFLQKYPNSVGKGNTLLRLMDAYANTNDMAKAVDTGYKILQIDPDNIATLRYLSLTFPFLFKPGAADETSKLSRADSDAHHGLDLLNKLQKPANVTDAQFQQGMKELRSVFNGCIGFVAEKRKDYPSAIAALKLATADNPSGWYAVYWMGLAYHFSTPRDYDHEIWYYARAVNLAKAGKDPNADDWEKYLKLTYMDYHGTDTGLSDIMAQTAAAADPPDGFKISKAEAPKPTGNGPVDAFNTLTFPLKLGGEAAQKQWDGVKGQAYESGGTVMSVEKGTDPNVYLVRIAVLDSTKSADGYDIELKNTTQPNVKNLQKNDLLTFKGTLDSYVATPNLILTLVGEVTSDLPDKPAAKPKPKPKTPVKPRPKPTTSN